jgi:putative flippase GtrA
MSLNPGARRLFFYVLTGGAAAVVDETIFTGLHALGSPLALAAVFSFCVAALVNYSLTSRFVFGHAPSLRQLGLFVAVAIVGMVINVGVTLAANATIPFASMLSGLADLVGAPRSMFAPLAVAPAKACGIAVAFVFNFYVNSAFVFRARVRPDAQRFRQVG